MLSPHDVLTKLKADGETLVVLAALLANATTFDEGNAAFGKLVAHVITLSEQYLTLQDQAWAEQGGRHA